MSAECNFTLQGDRPRRSKCSYFEDANLVREGGKGTAQTKHGACAFSPMATLPDGMYNVTGRKFRNVNQGIMPARERSQGRHPRPPSRALSARPILAAMPAAHIQLQLVYAVTRELLRFPLVALDAPPCARIPLVGNDFLFISEQKIPRKLMFSFGEYKMS